MGENVKGQAESWKVWCFDWVLCLKNAGFFFEGRIIDISIAIAIGSKLQKFIGIVVKDKILRIIGRKIADENIFINLNPGCFPGVASEQKTFVFAMIGPKYWHRNWRFCRF